MHGESSLSRRLESGELVDFTQSPFPLPSPEDQVFLRQQTLAHRSTAAIEWHTADRQLIGHRVQSSLESERLGLILDQFTQSLTAWLSAIVPAYTADWTPSPTLFHPEEEAIRSLGFQHRKDLLHLEQPSHEYSHGRRLLRVMVNLHPEESRVWTTAETFPELLERYLVEHRISDRTIEQWSQPNGWPRLWTSDRKSESPFDRFSRKLDHFLKTDDAFQDKARRRFWHFAPESAWVLFADGLSHAELRGQFALEQTFLIPLESLHAPELSPIARLADHHTLPRRLAS